MALAGNRVKATDIFTGLWTAYTPTWTSSGTAPVLVNGTIQGRYCQMGKLVIAEGRMNAGTSTTYGTGTYSWSLPVTSANPFSGNSAIGTVWIRDSSAGDFQGVAIDAGTTFIVRPGASAFGGNTAVGQTAPMTWASGDWITWFLCYEAA